MDRDYEKDEIILHPTDGKYIVEAISGMKTRHLVGSKFEPLFWKMVDVLSLPSDDSTTKTGKTFFFTSPEAYEAIRHVELNEKVKNTWRKKRLRV